jgi:Tol biopolymer transport system component
MIMAISLILGSYQIFAQTAEELFPKAIQLEEVKGELEKAIEVYQTIVTKFSANRPIAAKAQFHIGLCYEKSGLKQAQQAYQKVLDNYSEQTDMVALAKAKLATLCSSGATGDTEVTMRRILATKNQPVGISHDGRYVIINLYESGDLWLHDLQSGEQRQITREASGVDWTFATGAAAISPDGKQIAYDWQAKSYGELRLSALDGSSMRVLHNGQDGRRMSVSDWMPDGRKMLAVSYDLKSFVCQLHIISLPDGTIRDIGQQSDSENIVWVCPSPNGRYIAYSRTGDIFIYDTATEHESVFVQNPAINALAGWTPDGSGIVFVSNRSGTHDLYLLGIENGKPRGDLQLLRKDFGANAGISLTHDGRLFRIENIGTSDSYIVPVDEKTGKVTGTASLVEPNYPNAAYPGWSSDGKLLYYMIFKESPNEKLLFIRPEATGQTREITLKPKLPYWYRPILSPDGQRFAVTGTDENINFGVFAIDLESGDVSQLARIPVENVPVDPSQNWSPDGKAIFYKVRSFEKSEEFIIRRKDLTTGEEKDVHRGIHPRHMKISPDGTRFVYFRNDSPTKSHVLGILDLQSGKELELWRIPEADSPEISDPTWTPDGKHVLVAKSLKQGTELWRFPVAGGQGEKLHLFPEYSCGFVMHPSGKRMAFTQSHGNYELWVMENFLPETKTKK